MTHVFILCVQFNITRHYYVHVFLRACICSRRVYVQARPTIHCILTSHTKVVYLHSGIGFTIFTISIPYAH